MLTKKTGFEYRYIGRNALTAGALHTFNVDFPVGEAYAAMHLVFTGTATVGANPVGATAFTQALLELFTSIQVEVPRDGLIINAPAKALYKIAQVKEGTAPQYSDGGFAANTAAAYNFRVNVPIYFADPRKTYSFVGALQTDRYNKITLRIATALASAMLKVAHSSGGGITLSNLNVDVAVVSIEGEVPASIKVWPIVRKILLEGGAKNVASETLVELERSYNRSLQRVYVMANNNSTTGVPCSGEGVNTIMDVLQLESDKRVHFQNTPAAMIQDINKLTYDMESVPAGLVVIDPALDGDNSSSLPTGDKSRLQAKYTLQSSLPSNESGKINTVSVVSEVLELLK